jgi:hypothetical protein
VTEEQKRVRRPVSETGKGTTIACPASLAATLDAAKREGESRSQCAHRLILEALAK